MEGVSSKYETIVIGTSAGGFHALSVLLADIPPWYPLSIIVVQHRAKTGNSSQADLLEQLLQTKCRIKIKQADEKEKIRAGIVYTAPADYHLLIEMDKTFSLSLDQPVHFSRPSIDVLFETASIAYGNKLVGIILTGANNDGSAGVRAIARKGGLTISQNPGEAEFPAMVKASIETKMIKHIWSLATIRDFILKIGERT